MRSDASGVTRGGVTLADRSVALCLFFASGFSGLVYQVLWMRALGILFGNTSFATATTLAAFFLGIAAGGLVFGRRAARWQRPLRAYAWLEAAVAVTALLYFALLHLFHAIYAPLFAQLGDSPLAFTAVKFALALLVLFPPAFCMGGTLPVMSQHLVRHAHALGATAATLYAVNTLGAALGAYLAAFHLIRHLGVSATYALALLVTAGVAALAAAFGGTPAPPARPAAPASATGVAPVSPAALRTLAFLSGWATLALEVLWTRMFAQVLQNSVYTFALILVTFLVALAAGAVVAGMLARRAWRPQWVLPTLLVGSALLVGGSPFLFFSETDGLQYIAADSGFAEYVARVFGSAARVLLLPTAWLGILFPYLIKLAEGWGRSAGSTVGELAALNTLGAVVGALAAGFVLLGSLGLWNSLRLVAATYLLAALVLAARPAARRAGSPAAAARLAAWGTPLAGLLLLAGVLDASHLPTVSVNEERGEEIVAVVEGSAATVAVIEQPDSRRMKLNNYYGLGGSGDRKQEAQQATLPILLHPAPRTVFFLGLGTGITAGAALLQPVERVLVAELVPEVVEASRRHFAPWLSGLFDDPRARVVVEDGRNLLAGTSERFDLVVADLFLPWKAGTGSLYARELYEAGLDRLAPGGMYAQWLLLIQLSEREFGSIARTFTDVFPRATLWRGNDRTSHPLVLLLGERDPAPFEPPDPSETFLAYQGNLTQAAALFAEHPMNSDDRPFIEYSAPVTHRQKRSDAARSFRGSTLLAFYDAVFETAPPERDPALAALPEAMRTLPRAGLELYRSAVLRWEGRLGAAAEARRRSERLRSGAGLPANVPSP